ncbi:Transmembrane protein 198-B [Dissostichus eleginoides]|uniref:Transmembrane protein 198 n=1 Tax=Dissostichus eleginoides TaxID=100907 RepID=A0AAD9CN25_DISEL|nr:Transmembrane protein 198-B [Dissostichus eleginoides]
MPSTSRLLGLVEVGLKCDQEIERRYEIVPSVVCSMCCLFGIIYCFFGYRCFKAVLFLTGLLFGSVVIFMLCYKERVMDTQLSLEASVGIGLGIGTLCGLVTMLVRSVGLFMVGLLLGLLLGVASLVTMEEFYHPKTVWVPLGILLGSGTLFAVLTLQWQRVFVTLSTATFGSAIITVTVDYFIELFALVHYIYERLRVAPKKPLCWFTWVILGVWPVLALLGVLIQWKVTAEGFSHTEVVLSRQQRRTEPGYHRKSNPKRRFDGDVLSPSYIRSFRDRQTDRRAYSQNRMMSRSRMAELDYDCGSRVPLTAPSGPPVRI